MSLQARKGFSTVSTSVNNTTVLKEKILPITSRSAQQTGLVKVFLCVPTENRRFLRIWIDRCMLSLRLGLHKKPTLNHHLVRIFFRLDSLHLPPIFVITKIQRPLMPYPTQFITTVLTFENLCNYKIR